MVVIADDDRPGLHRRHHGRRTHRLLRGDRTNVCPGSWPCSTRSTGATGRKLGIIGCALSLRAWLDPSDSTWHRHRDQAHPRACGGGTASRRPRRAGCRTGAGNRFPPPAYVPGWRRSTSRRNAAHPRGARIWHRGRRPALVGPSRRPGGSTSMARRISSRKFSASTASMRSGNLDGPERRRFP